MKSGAYPILHEFITREIGGKGSFLGFLREIRGAISVKSGAIFAEIAVKSGAQTYNNTYNITDNTKQTC